MLRTVFISSKNGAGALFALGLGCVALGLAVAVGRPLNLLATAAAVGVVSVAIAVQRPWFLFCVAALAMLLPLPAGTPLGMEIGGTAFYVFDLLLPASAIALLGEPASSPLKRAPLYPALLFACTVVLGIVVGLLKGVPAQDVLWEARPAVYLLIAYFIGLSIDPARDRRLFLWLSLLILWYSAIGIVLSAVTRHPVIGGRISSAATGAEGFHPGAVARFQISSTVMALLVLCICVAAALTLTRITRARITTLLALGTPAVVVVVLSFSRQGLIALIVTLGLALVVTARKGRFLVGPLIVTLLVAAIALPLLLIGSDDVALFLQAQKDTFSDRVLEGLTESGRSRDQGLELRKLENYYAWRAFLSEPVTGLGLGSSYRPLLPLHLENFFPQGVGPKFAHNSYLWYLAKTGTVGFLGLLVFLLHPLPAALARGNRSEGDAGSFRLALGLALVGLLMVNIAAPYLNDLPNVVVFGFVIGFLAATQTWKNPAAGDGTDPGDHDQYPHPKARYEPAVTSFSG